VYAGNSPRIGQNDLAILILNGHDIGHVVDDNRVMDVVEDYVVGRWYQIGGMTAPDWNREKYWNRQHKKRDWRRRRQ
jgi:hypothetical protein